MLIQPLSPLSPGTMAARNNESQGVQTQGTLAGSQEPHPRIQGLLSLSPMK